jgi:hypothetical protein
MWRSLEAAQAMGESFMVEKALLLSHIGTKSNSNNALSSTSNLRTSGNNLLSRSNTSPGKQCSFDLSFRQGGSSVVDELSLVVNIPSLVSMQKELQVGEELLPVLLLPLPVLLLAQSVLLLPLPVLPDELPVLLLALLNAAGQPVNAAVQPDAVLVLQVCVHHSVPSTLQHGQLTHDPALAP